MLQPSLFFVHCGRLSRVMEAALVQISDIASTVDEASRKKLVIALRDTMYSIESEDDTMHRIMFLVSRP